MKQLITAFLFMISASAALAQSDTLYTGKKKIPCKIEEINEYEIKYRLAEMPAGPVYVIDKMKVQKYTLANGFTETIVRDELSVEHEHEEIMGNRRVIKFSPFSIPFNHVTLSYEKVLKVGTNLDVQAGYINSAINSNLYGYQNAFHSGAYIKPGVKFFVGQDFSVKGLKYAHPLKGRYIRLDMVASFVNYQNLQRYEGGFTTPTRTITSNLNAFSYGAFANYGRQFILGNILTLDYYVGVGFTGIATEYSNPAFTNANGYYINDYSNLTFFYTHYRIPRFGMSFTGGFRIGYILPEKKVKKKEIKKQN